MTATAEIKPGGDPPSGDSRRAARLMAVQALYQMEMSGGTPARVIGEFLEHRQEDDGDLDEIGAALFEDLVTGVAGAESTLDELVAEVLKEGWRVGRLELVLKAILRCGAFELRDRPAVPRATVIDEYVSLAHGFFGGKEPGLVNGVLEHLAGQLRGGGEPAGNDHGKDDAGQ